MKTITKTKNVFFRLIVALLLLNTNASVTAQFLKPGDIIYENDALEGTNPQGVVFWVDETGYGGWIVNLKDHSGYSQWSDGSTIPGITIATDRDAALTDTAGWRNTRAILAKYPGGSYAANQVDFDNGWYLPTAGQLNTLYGALPEVNNTFEILGTSSANKLTGDYWSSTAYDNSVVWYVNFDFGVVYNVNVDDNCRVRSVRAFNSLNYLIHSGRVAVSGNADSEITNTLVYGNKDKENGEANLTSTGTVAYTAVESTAPSGAGNTTVAGGDFVNDAADYRLDGTSPLINAGNNDAVPAGLTIDLDGNSRKIDVVDIGAYEYKKKLPAIAVATPQETTYTGKSLYITPGTTSSGATLIYKYINRAAPGDTLSAAQQAGTYDVLVISPSIGDFAEGSVKVVFNVGKAPIILEPTAKNTGYTGSPVAIDPPVIRGGTAATDLAGTLNIQYNGSPTPPTGPGTYSVNVAIDSDGNHTGTTAQTTLTITQGGASLFMSDQTVVYDGTPQTLTAFSNPAGLAFTYLYAGTLSNGSSTPYGPITTPPTDAGTYTVTATFAGNAQYAGGAVQAKLTIEKAPVTVVVGSQTVINGGTVQEHATILNAMGATVSGLLTYAYEGIGATTYPGPAMPVNSADGTYQITASFDGDANYLPATGTGLLTILPAGSPQPGISLRDTTVVYGNPYAMAAVTDPATLGATLTYSGVTWNGDAHPTPSMPPTDAGRYTVTAVSGTDGVTYTESSTVTANLTIGKAPQTIDMPQTQFDGKNETNIHDVIPVDATVSSPAPTSASGLPVALTSSDPSVAGISGMNLTIHSTGSTLIKAEQAGNNNYQAAAPVYRLLYVKGNPPPVIVTDLQDTAVSSTPATLQIEATGYDLTYQWYFNGKPIVGAVSDNIRVREEGVYYVVVSNVGGSVESYHATFTLSIVDPVTNRKVVLPAVEGLHTSPSPGTHYVESRKNFVFEMWPAAGYSIDEVAVTTDGGNLVELEPAETEGRTRVTVRMVNRAINIQITGVTDLNSGVGNGALPSEARAWSYQNRIHIYLPEAGEVSVYTLTGTLHTRRRLSAGDTALPMPAGVYFVQLPGGAVSKVIVNN